MPKARLYRLSTVLDDPEFETFGWDLPSLTGAPRRTYDFTHFGFTELDYEIPSLRKSWDTPKMTYEDGVTSSNDFPCCEFHVPVFSNAAAKSLRDMLEPNGELLPVRSTVGKFFAFQSRTLVDGLIDPSKTTGDRMYPGSPIFYNIEKYAFRRLPKIIPPIFRLRENPSPILVTLEFADRVRAEGLRGFDFRQLPRV